MSSYDVVVVGSGLGGISCAALLARAGQRVIVVERAENAGGYAHAFRRGPYTFDPAVHAMVEGEYVGNILDYLDESERVDLIPVDTFYDAVYPDHRFRMPFGVEEATAALAELFPAERDGIQAFFGLRDQIFTEASQLPHHVGVGGLDDAATRFPTFFAYRKATVNDALDAHLRDPVLRSFATSVWPYSASPPSRCGFLWFSQMLGTFLRGTYYARGSFQSLVDGFVRALEASGGALLLASEAVDILLEDGAVAGVELDGGEVVRAPVVVSNADATRTLNELVGRDNLPRAYLGKLDRLKPSLSAFSIYTAAKIDLGPHGLGHETFLYRHRDHDETWRDIEAGRPGGVWISTPSLLDTSLPPPGEHTVIVTSLARYDALDWQAERERFGELLLDELERVVPGYRDALTFFDTATPQALAGFSGARDGAAYGWEATPQQTASGRLPHETPVTGLYLSGAWTQQAHGSFRTIVSGEQVARLVLEHLGSGELPSFRPAHLPPVAI